MADFTEVKNMLVDLGLVILKEDPQEELVIVENEEEGIKNMIIDCEPEENLLIIEQPLGKLKEIDGSILPSAIWFLTKNRELAFGAFAFDENSKIILYRNTLYLDTLDFEELQSTISSLSLFLAENSQEILKYLC